MSCVDHRVTTSPSAIGHVRLNDRGVMLALDSGFSAMLGNDADDLIGRSVLDVTAPDFRATCAAGMAALRATGDPFVVTKQMVRRDGTRLWVTQTTAPSSLFADRAILATFVAVRVTEPERDPRALLANAKFLAASIPERNQIFGKTLLSNPCWDLLVAAYIADAEGRITDTPALAATAALDPVLAVRWVRAMVGEGLLEIENADAPPTVQRYRLSAAAHESFERFLTRRLTRFGGFAWSNARSTPVVV